MSQTPPQSSSQAIAGQIPTHDIGPAFIPPPDLLQDRNALERAFEEFVAAHPENALARTVHGLLYVKVYNTLSGILNHLEDVRSQFDPAQQENGAIRAALAIMSLPRGQEAGPGHANPTEGVAFDNDRSTNEGNDIEDMYLNPQALQPPPPVLGYVRRMRGYFLAYLLVFQVAFSHIVFALVACVLYRRYSDDVYAVLNALDIAFMTVRQRIADIIAPN
ncbi:hypothetical protein PHLGIDRAFT_32427 [Phlebiopsis gigantea 11061_1 CR5-6]|uniref:Uncharacterized protein n=1 Tax=Phlebiopsis gigantea (strain 11061_1 CR5-6) TaxID=745531 RepID=A0A0C3S2G5_PHLG1|nr:hypothetical protein PHLGIDRAFT_32427 [Phlebiopsis gigantea 11061_1 CR5-6]